MIRFAGSRAWREVALASAVGIFLVAGCKDEKVSAIDEAVAAPGGAGGLDGRAIFRFDDFGNSRFWTDSLRLNDVVETLTPNQALGLGLKVDVDAIPAATLQAVKDNPALLDDPAITRALLGFNAVLGVTATVQGDQVTRLGITCALCHSSVDNSVTTGIGHRKDGWANHDLAVGTIISVAPGLPPAVQPVYASWPRGFYDARFNFDGINDPAVIPPAYGLHGVDLETYTGEGPISYWNQYVAVTQMHGIGSFVDDRLGINIVVPAKDDLVKSKLPALRQYQLSLTAPPPPQGSFNAAAAARGEVVFRTTARCASCHTGPKYTDDENLHAAAETGMDPVHAQRSTTGLYRTTPLRGLWQHAPYFHDGSAPTLAAVVDHYNSFLRLGLTASQRADLIEFLKSL
jgi:hypothetical protein